MRYIVLSVVPVYRGKLRISFGVFAQTDKGEMADEPLAFTSTRELAELVADSLTDTQPLLDPAKAKQII